MTDKPKSPQTIITDAYQECYMKSHGGEKPKWVNADFKHCKDLLKDWDAQQVANTIRFMFATEDKLWSDHTGTFMSLTSTRFLQRAIDKMTSRDKPASDVMLILQKDYFEKFRTRLIVDPETNDKFRQVASTFNPKVLRAMWLTYIKEGDEAGLDMRMFIRSGILNRLARVVTARTYQRCQKDDAYHTYICEGSLRDAVTGMVMPSHKNPIYDKQCSSEYWIKPCAYCGKRMMREDLWEAENLRRYHHEPLKVTSPLVAQAVKAIPKQEDFDDLDLDENFL